MRQRIIMAFSALFIVGLLVGCSKKADDEVPDAAEVPVETEEIETAEKELAEEVIEEEEDEVEINEPVENLGGMEIELAGTASVDGRMLKVDGQTNLLEGSKLIIGLDWVEGALFGGNSTAIVEPNGSFTYETKLPEKVDGLIMLEVKFEPARQNEEIKVHYGESGEHLKGPFIREYDFKMKEIVYEKASATVELPLDDGAVEAEIAPPNWNKPDDYGTASIRIELIKITKGERYTYIDGESNLLEGTKLRSRAILPGYITSGFIGHTAVNPDGSFRIIFDNPETDSRIKNLDEYEITIETDLYNTLFATAIEAYGENGEKMTGELVEEEGEGKKAKVSIREKKG